MAIDELGPPPGPLRRDAAARRNELPAPESGKAASREPTGRSPESPSAAVDDVAFSARAERLAALVGRVADVPAFDENRVQDIRRRIEAGEYPVNAERLAERFIALERQLDF